MSTGPGPGADFDATWAYLQSIPGDDIGEADDPHAEMTNADVMSYEEMHEYDRAAEFHLDAIDEARNIAEAEANDHHDDAGFEYEDDSDDEDGAA